MTAANSDTELLTEHFGYPPVSLLDEIINSINFIAERALASVEQGLLNAPPQQIGFGNPPSASASANSKSKRKGRNQPPQDAVQADLSPEEIEEQARAEIANGTHQLETLLCTSIDRNFDKFELYVMRNILCVKPEDRDWIRLGHYEGLNFDNLPSTVMNTGSSHDDGGGDKMDVDTPDVPTVESVNRLRRRLQASQKLNTMLHADKARNDALLGELRALVGKVGTKGSRTSPTAEPTIKGEPADARPPPFAFLHNKGDLAQADASTPLTTTTAFSLSQLQALRALSTSLSNILPDIKTPADATGDSSGGKTWRKERVEYVESAARKHLEKVRGLELGKNGEVRDGECQGEGRRFAGGEAETLEGFVNVLGSTGGAEGVGLGADDDMDQDDVE